MIATIRKIQILLGICSFTYCLSYSETFAAPIWLLPLLYTIGVCLCKHNIVKLLPGIVTINILMLLRYVYAPFAYYQSGFINEMLSDFSHIDEAVYLMLYELLFVFIILEFTGIHTFEYIHSGDNVNKAKLSYLKSGKKLPLLLSVVFLLVYIGLTYKSLGQGLSIFFSGSLDEMDEMDDLMEPGQGYINIVWQSLTVWLYYYVIMKAKHIYERGNRLLPVSSAIAATVVFVILTFVDSTGITRWYTLVSAGACLACLLHLFPLYHKQICTAIIIPLAALMVYTSLVKNGGYEKGTNVSNETVNGAFGATNIDVYCNGLGNVNAIFQFAYSSQEAGIQCLPYDLLRSMPIICHYLPKGKDSSSLFHKTVGRKDQIMPCIGQSMVYFGFLLSPLLSCLIILFIRKFDILFLYDFSYRKYSYAFTAIWVGAIIMSLNISLLFMWIYIRLIPFYLILSFTEKFAEKKYIQK